MPGRLNGAVALAGLSLSSSCVETFQTAMTEMSALSSHPRGALFAAGSCRQQLQVHQWEPRQRRLATIRYHGGFLRQRIGPVRPQPLPAWLALEEVV